VERDFKMSDKKKDDGGPAFPCTGNPEWPFDHGMSLRDYFAGMALQGLLASNQEGLKDPGYYTVFCYGIADSMLAARKS
jgi:hypothetical protein